MVKFGSKKIRSSNPMTSKSIKISIVLMLAVGFHFSNNLASQIDESNKNNKDAGKLVFIPDADHVANKLEDEHLVDYDVETKCKELPTIRSSGLSFPNVGKVRKAKSFEGIEPSFHFGTQLDPKKVPYHMKDDSSMFKLIQEHTSKFSKKEKNISFDIGANQGFFTYFLAAIGLEVHAFEIDKTNFLSLQHGLFYNPKEMVDRVHLYPAGISDVIARIGMQGTTYEGFLKAPSKASISDNDINDVTKGNILSVTFDCFQYHVRLNLDKIAFVKIDVEGFEIAALKGTKHTLFPPHNSTISKSNKNIGSLLMEVGPSRWSRANIKLDDGIQEMTDLGTNYFQNAYVILRTKGNYKKSCPDSLAKKVKLSDQNPRKLDGIHMHKIRPNEWKPLLAGMHSAGSDCNFWFTNNPN